ncbi:BlaR1 family beta-lactam sensor/signal transducer [Shouchella clausii]|nr:BlaR1 family beta-lactam sensor/signal transducer [Shouchella clausii]
MGIKMTLPHILLSLVLITATILVIFFVRAVFYKQLSAKWRYHLWFLLIAVLTLPFIPVHLLTGLSFFDQGRQQITPSAQERFGFADQNEQWMVDFGTSVSRFDDTFIHAAFVSIWIGGMIFFLLLTLYHYAKLQRLVKAATKIQNQKVQKVFSDCMAELQITNKLTILESPAIQTPMTFGLFNTYILLPKNIELYLSDDEIRHVLLHELYHYKSRHIKLNYLFVLYQIVYWFHPLVWKAFKEMRLDRELACDTEVLLTLGQREYKAYGQTIMRFLERNSRFLYLTNQLHSSKKALKIRILNIASFTGESKRRQLKSMVVFAVLSVFVIAQFPFLTATAVSTERYQFDESQAVVEDYSTYFAGNEGSFVLYSLNSDQFEIYNKEKSVRRVSPNSSYKIYTALMALELGVIGRDDSWLDWDGVEYEDEAWNSGQDLKSAMSQSVTWYFQELDVRIKQRNIQSFVNQLDYGNKDLSGGLNHYWLESSLKISPVEQVELLHSFYTNQLGFKEEHVQFVKEVMKLEENQKGTLYGKTGTGIVNGHAINGWFIGFVETETDTYFFATNIQQQDHAYGSTAAEITLSILSSKGIY